MKNLKYTTSLALLGGLTLSLSNQIWASDTTNSADDLYQKAGAIFSKHFTGVTPVPLEYFEALDQAASAGSLKAKQDLEIYSHDVHASPDSMQAKVIWGGTSETNEKIRTIFKKWAPKK